MFRYRVSGLSVSSDLALPGVFAGEIAQDDVIIRHGAVPDALDGAVAAGPNWSMAPGLFLLRIPGIVRFLLNAGQAITYQTEADAAPGDVTAFLVGTAFGVLLHQRGQIVLHASGVAVNGKAMVFLGQSGAGKSTLAVALGQRGYRPVTDDFCVVGIDALGEPLVYPDGRLPRLWNQAIDRLDLVRRRGQAVRGRLEKFYVEPALEASPEPLPLGAVYALREARPPLRAGIERPNLVDAALLLRRNAYRPRLIARMDQGARYFHLAATIGNRAGIFHLTREQDFAALPDLIALLERHWAAAP